MSGDQTTEGERKPPEWGDDLLSKYFAEAAWNERVSSLNFGDAFALIQRMDGMFRRLAELTANSREALLLIPRVLMVRANAAVLGAARMGMAGHAVEANMVLRGAIEASWYALHIAKDPEPVSRATAWLNRDEDDETRRQCLRMFHPERLRETHEAVDPRTAGAMETLYRELISSGAHPNERGILAAITRNELPNGFILEVHVLSNNPVLIRLAMKFTIETGIGVLKTFQSVFPERYRLTGFDDEIESLVGTLYKAFPTKRRTIWSPS